MGPGGRLALVVMLVLVTLGGVAEAGRVVVADTHAEADLADEAGGFTLLLRAALDRPGRPVVASHELRGVVIDLERAAALLDRLDGDALLACDLERDGTGLRVSVIVLDRSGTVGAAASIRAGDGDLARLVAEAVRVAAPVVGPDAAVPQVSLGQVRPFVRAAAAVARGDLATAALELQAAEAVVPLKVSSIGATLSPGWAGAAVDQPTALAMALGAGTPQDVFDVAQAGTPRDRAARAIAHLAIAANDAAARELAGGGGGDEPLLVVAAARLASRRGQADKLAAAVEKLLARPAPYLPALVLVAELPAGAVPVALEDAALRQAAADPRWSRLASVLGLRAAQRGSGDRLAALAAIRVADLDDAEVSRLTPIVEQAMLDRSRPALRLAAELAARKGERGAIDAAVKDWLGVAADDPGAQLWRGRIALAAMRLDEAKVAFAAARADRELARVAIAAGDWTTAARLLESAPETSAERHVVAARLALAKGDAAAARIAVEAATLAAPASRQVLQVRVITLEQGGDAAAAQRLRALAKRVTPPEAAAVDLEPSRTADGGGRAPVAGAAAIDEDLVTELSPVVGALPLPPGGTVAVIELASPSPGWFSLREARPRPLRAPLQRALELRGLTVVSGGDVRVAEPLDRPRLDAAARTLSVPLLVLYQVRADGSTAQIKLVVFDRASGSAQEARDAFDGAPYGLVGWNHGRIQLGAVVLGLGVLALGFWLIRGRSRIAVTIVLDPDGRDEVLCLEVSRSPTRPAVDDATRFRKEKRKAGHEVSSHAARLAGPRTVFPVAPGTWFVHVYGVYTRDHGDRVVPPLHSKKLEVSRGATGEVTFDLGLPVAEIKVTLHDARRAGIAVWLDSELADKVYTDADGHATLYATVGQHTLCIDAGDLRIERPLPIVAAQIEKVLINLPRERRLAEVSEGLTLGPSAHGPAIAPAHDAQIGTMIELASGATPLPYASPAAAAPTVPAPALTPASPTAATQAMVSPPPGPSAARTTPGDEPTLHTRVLGRYRIDAELGRGAMGVVFKAWDENLERPVAVKVLARAVREIPQAMTFFLQEAKALAQLNHPNIVAVHDQASDAADTYIIMELVDGTTLDRLLQERGRLPLRTALGVIDQLCNGLAYAHGKKVIHRDIKPANVFISREKVVKLGDFGIARVMRELEIRQTDVRGTPLYMSPEQINGTNINHRADLYAVGCTLFELCAGQPPFTEGNVMAHHLFTEPPLLSAQCPGAPAALDDLILACLTKDSTARIGSATEIQDRMRAIAAELPR